jgi:hypothetical protein
MKSLVSKITAAALGLALCFGASASASIPVAMAPASSQQSLQTITSRYIVVVEYIYVGQIGIVGDLPRTEQSLQHVDQAAEFDRTN